MIQNYETEKEMEMNFDWEMKSITIVSDYTPPELTAFELTWTKFKPLIGGGTLVWYFEDDKIKTRIL